MEHLHHLVFSCYGGMARECDAFYKRLAELLAEKRDLHQSIVTNWIRTRINFYLLRSTLLCIRGSRSYKIRHDPINDIDIKLAKYSFLFIFVTFCTNFLKKYNMV